MNVRWVTDLVAVALWTVAAAAVVLYYGWNGPVRAALVLPLLVVLPGYALVSALYPEGRNAPVEDARRFGTGERLAYSVALSVGIVPLTVFVLNFVTGIYVRPMLLAITGITLALTALGLVRRGLTDPGERFSPGELIVPEGPVLPGGTYGVLLVGSLLVFAASGAFAAFADPTPQSFTEFYLVAPSDSGNMTQEAVSGAVSNGGQVRMVASNSEGQSTRYTVVVLGQQVQDGQVAQSNELLRQSTGRVPPGKRVGVTYQVPDDPGDRVVFLLYRGDAPETASKRTAYRSTQVWTTGGDQQALAPPRA